MLDARKKSAIKSPVKQSKDLNASKALQQWNFYVRAAGPMEA
jgi:hypothetical protein